ncbi:MAG: metal ABC transporter permease [bacterium]|nr:metal ABC transporter permease [bacterium]
MPELLQYEFIRNALIAGLLTSIACGLIGSLVVVNRIVFISGGIAHSAFGGIGLGVYFGFSPLVGAGCFSILAASMIGLITLNNKHRADTVIGVLWAVGMAVGIVLIDISPGYNVDLMSYLFGSILAVPGSDLLLMLILDIIIILCVLFFYKDLLAMSYDEEFAALRGIPVKLLYILMLVLVALTVVMTIRVVGLILVIALMTIPTYISEKFSSSLGKMMFLSFILASLFTFTGLVISYYLNITSGASIILVAGVCFLVFQSALYLKSLRNS